MTDQTWNAAGVIPIAIYNKQLYVLLGKEAKGRDKGKYDAFGGGRNKEDKTAKDTAVRECYEESMGFFGSQSYIQKNMKQYFLRQQYLEYYLAHFQNLMKKYNYINHFQMN